MTQLHTLSVKELADGLANKDFSSTELTQYFLQRIDKHDKQLNSFITVTPELALAQAKQADERLKSGNAHPLTGIPIAHKDIFNTQGILTTCGSKMLANYVAPYDATIVTKCNNAGLVTLGKTSMDEFAMGSDNESSYFGAVHNPWALDYVPGGSSGGSAAAVAGGLAPLATGSDTGGSIRQPASFCGLTGIKPTYGRVSRFGMIAYASSFDQAGSFGKSAQDCAYLLEIMSGFDAKDSTCVNKSVPTWTADLANKSLASKDLTSKGLENKPLQGLRIGVPSEYFGAGLQDDVKTVINQSLQQYEQLGATLVDVHLTNPEITLAAYYLLAPAEASSNLSRYDGVRFGYRCENPTDLTDLYTRSRSEGFGAEVQRRILMGTYALSAGYCDAYYVKAQKVRRLILNDFNHAFDACDVIATPTAPTPAYKIGASLTPSEIYMGDVYTIGVNLAGLPALSHPVGFVNGLPVGLQLIGKHWTESELFHLADAYQQATDFHTQLSTIAKE
ncbi:aspartyl/glutamyl-tRNA amidotransferase subunit A [Moraxella macacae 0408225]|uniref:Glutamyl-tRNA(Gln) amidotransferase subunit A n=2 Tax=Pseudomonadota TaxID=1224 RepID=L2F7H4_9GAMM|nr:Asp-tRNA(Asn)/Glu-tRNA(Gln) amidotransferase subunit GatA [Moraxella macacae]ELA08982.1 aspartyl/glutamyl-tRNA amidotransferase subunit A [Moraxella macacae 0408225]